MNPKEECDFLTYSRTNTELQRFFGHLVQRHPDELLNFLIHYVTNHSFTDITNISCIDQINDYLLTNILSKQNANTVKSDYSQLPKSIELKKYDLSRLNQIILERGITENLPLSTIMSRNHIQFITEFAKMGFMFARNSSMKMDDFVKILDEVTIPKTLLQQVGNDYFLCSLDLLEVVFVLFKLMLDKSIKNQF